MFDIKWLEKKVNEYDWDVLEKDDLVNDQFLVAIWEDKIIELLADGTANLIFMYSAKTEKKDQFGDPVYEDFSKSYKVKEWENLADLLAFSMLMDRRKGVTH